MLTPNQQHKLLRITKSACAIIDLSKDIIVVMGLNIATAGRIFLGVLESYHHVRSYQEAAGRPGGVMNWCELRRFAEQHSYRRVVLSTSSMQGVAHDRLYPGLGFELQGRRQVLGELSIGYFALPLRGSPSASNSKAGSCKSLAS